jgi:hypothetical protein
MRISRIRLSSGISHSRRQNSLTDNPAGFDYQHLFYHSSRSVARWRFRLLFSAAYLSGILLSDWCYHAVSLYSIQIRTPSLGQVFPSTESPPASIDAGSMCHQPVFHCYYGFIRPLLTHWSGFPIQVIPRLLLPILLNQVTRKLVEIALRPLLVHLCSGLWLPIRELCTTLRGVALPFSSSWDRPGRWDFNPADTKCYCSRSSILFKCPVVILSFLCFEHAVTAPRTISARHPRTGG